VVLLYGAWTNNDHFKVQCTAIDQVSMLIG
jgi:hypothetical protein